MLRCSTRYLLVAVVVVAGLLAVVSRWPEATSWTVVVGLTLHRVRHGVRRMRRSGKTSSSPGMVGLIAGSAFLAVMGVFGAISTFWSVAWWVHGKSGDHSSPVFNLGAGTGAGLIVLIVLADPLRWWATDVASGCPLIEDSFPAESQ